MILEIIYLLYSLSFFTLGVALFTASGENEEIGLSLDLPWMALFALTHSLSEFAILDKHLLNDLSPYLYASHALSIVSFAFLFTFAVRITLRSARAQGNVEMERFKWPLHIWPVLILLTTAILMFIDQSEAGWSIASTISKFTLGLPGSILAAISLRLYYRIYSRVLSDYKAKRPMEITGLSLFGYGMVSIPSDGPPPEQLPFLISREDFSDFFGFPIEVIRMLFALSLTFGFIGFIRVLNRTRKNRYQEYVVETQRMKSGLESIIHHSYDAIAIHDRSGQIVMANRKMLELFNTLEGDKNQLSTLAGLSPPGQPGEELISMWNRVNDGATEFLEWKLRSTVENVNIPVEIYSCPIQLFEEEPFILTSIRDLRERYKDQELIRALMDFQRGILLVFRNGKLIQGNLRFYCEFKLESIDQWKERYPAFEAIITAIYSGMELPENTGGIRVNRSGEDSIQLNGKKGTDSTYLLDLQTLPLSSEESTFVCTLTDVTNLAVERKILQEESARDSLTGAANRREFDRALKRMIESSIRSGRMLSLILIDVDHFKRINDRGGHQEGDRILQDLSRLIQKNIRPGDLFARYGGEEFAIIAPDLDGDRSCHLADRIRKRIESKLQFREEPVTCSLGIGLFSEKIHDSATLIRIADLALYDAKKKGRNRIECRDEPGMILS